MRILYVDTETTGKPKDYKRPVSDVDNWPRLVQLGYILEEDDKSLQEYEFIIRPNGFEIPVEASNIHGVTQELALKDGASLGEVMDKLLVAIVSADIIVGHNISFDMAVLGAEYYRIIGRNPLEEKRSICTMKISVNFCKLPGNYGFKWPKLNELFFKLFEKEMGAAHTALQDISNTQMCFHELVTRGVIKL